MTSPAATIDEIDDALAKVAQLMRAQGEHGLAYLPIFERLERERETMANLDDRLDRALARARTQSAAKRPDRTRTNEIPATLSA